MLEVTHVLSQYPPECQPAQIEPLGFAGGMSGAQFWRVSVVRGSHDPAVVRGFPDAVVRGSADPAQRMLCLRRWPIEHPSPQRLKFIHAVLQHAARDGISFVPIPLGTRDGESFVHHDRHLWQLEPWMPGSADYEQSPRVEKLRGAMTALAQLHVATGNFQQSAITLSLNAKAQSIPTTSQSAIPRRLAQLREHSHGGTNELSRAITGTIWPELAPLARQFIAAFPIAAQNAIKKLEPLTAVPLPIQPCLRDIWHDHILFTGEEVTGIIDFGAVDIDTPATDIARLLGSLVADDSEAWQTGLAAYSAVRPLSPEESLAVVALDRSGTVLAGCNWIRWIYVDRRTFENRQQVIDRFCRILKRVSLSPPKT
jgi:Ser/Thr protein kinase RdoA (MazF antagonist)